jgi:hypothetical protein
MEDAVSSHRFKIGQSVNCTSGPFGAGSASGVYKITQLLPPEDPTPEAAIDFIKQMIDSPSTTIKAPKTIQ